MMNVHRLLRVKPIESITKNKSEWVAFLLFNILDHICTTSFVFANLLEIYSKTFVSSQRYRNMIEEAFL
jgi:methyltransferase-like protein